MALFKKLGAFYPIRKAWNYIRLRFVTVALLWLAAGGALRIFNALAESLTDGPHASLKMLSLGAFSDYRLIVILGVGVLALAGLSSIILMNITPNSSDREWAINFIARLWDEVSSAATHACAALISAQIFSAVDVWWPGIPPGTRWIVICLYLLLGYCAYRDETKTKTVTPASSQHSAGQGAAPNAASAPSSSPAQSPAPTINSAPVAQPPAP